MQTNSIIFRHLTRTRLLLLFLLILLVIVIQYLPTNKPETANDTATSQTLDDAENPEMVSDNSEIFDNTGESDPSSTGATLIDLSNDDTPPIPPDVPPEEIVIPSEPVENQIIIRFSTDATLEERNAYIQSLGGTVHSQIDALNSVVISIPETAMDKLAETPAASVIISEPDYYVGILETPNDAYYPDQWALPVIGLPEGWEGLSDTPVTIAIIDSGICAEHPDLQGRIMAGWDFIDDDNVPQDDLGHGCAIAGVIAANGNNGVGIAGVAPNAQIMPLRVLNATGIGTYSDVAAAIVYATDNGAQIINLSLGGYNPSSILLEAINYAVNRRVMVIAAAGNDGQSTVMYPAAYESVVAVGSIAPNLSRSMFSNFGSAIDLYAPGQDIFTTSLDGYAHRSGTSISSAIVSGVASVEIGQGRSLVPSGGIVLVSINGAGDSESTCDFSLVEEKRLVFFDLQAKREADPTSVSDEEYRAAASAYLESIDHCYEDQDIFYDHGGLAAPGSSELSAQYLLFGRKWGEGSPFEIEHPPALGGTTITYSFMPDGVDMSAEDSEFPLSSSTAITSLPTYQSCFITEIEDAFDIWAAVADVTFVKVASDNGVPFNDPDANADIRIGAHPIDQEGSELNTLGHGYFPPPDEFGNTDVSGTGDIHFDVAENWNCTTAGGAIDIGIVALHEIGHALGLRHESGDPDAVMFPSYNPILDGLTNLPTDDANGIKAIYGAQGGHAPVALAPANGGETSANLPMFEWAGTADADIYRVEVADVVDFAAPLIVVNVTAPTVTYDNSTVFLPNGDYYWRVRGYDNTLDTWTPWSTVNQFTVASNTPALISPADRSVHAPGDVTLTWSAAIGATTYELWVATDPEFPELVYQNNSLATLNDTLSLSSIGTYYWRVRPTGTDHWSQVWTFRIDQAPTLTSPMNSQSFYDGYGSIVESQPGTGITFDWEPIVGATNYRIQMGVSPNFVGLLFMDDLFMDDLFMDDLFMDDLFMDDLFMDDLFMDDLFMDDLFMDDLFMDDLFMDDLFMNNLFMDDLSVDNITIGSNLGDNPYSEGVHFWRVRARDDDGLWGAWSSVQSFIINDPTVDNVVINEFNIGGNGALSWIELTNADANPIDISNWHLLAYDANGTMMLDYTFPTYTLASNEFVIITMDPTVFGTSPSALEMTGLVYNAPLDWPQWGGGAIVLRDENTNEIDLVRFGQSPNIGTSWGGNNVFLPIDLTSTHEPTLGRNPHSTDDDHVTDWARQDASPGRENHSHVVINEILTGSVDAIELFNPSIENIDIGGWQLRFYEAGTEAAVTYTFPEGTLIGPHAPANRYVVVHEYTTTPPILESATVFSLDQGIDIPWADTNPSGVAELFIPDINQDIDFVRFGIATATSKWWSGNTPVQLVGQALGRDSFGTDTNIGDDWTPQNPSLGNRNPFAGVVLNDAITDPILIDLSQTLSSFRDVRNTQQSKTDPTEPTLPEGFCGYGVGHTVWYQIILSGTTENELNALSGDLTRFNLTTNGSDFDTSISLWRDDGGGVYTSLACNDDNSGEGLHSSIHLPSLGLLPDIPYYIMVGSNGNTAGNLILTLDPPDNDDFDSATVIDTSTDVTFGPTVVNNTFTSRAADDPIPSCAPNAGRTIWYSYTLSSSQTLQFQTVSDSFTGVISVWKGNRGELLELGCASGISAELIRNMQPQAGGETYYIMLAGVGDSGGDIQFEIATMPTSPNDTWADASPILSHLVPARLDGSTLGATPDASDPTISCGNSIDQKTIWFSFTPATTGNYSFDTIGSDFTTRLSIWTGSPGVFTPHGCLSTGNTESLNLSLTGGVDYYIMVHGVGGGWGNLVLTVGNGSGIPAKGTPPSHDDITTPVVIDPTQAYAPGTIDIYSATSSTDDPIPTCNTIVGNTVWYSLTPVERILPQISTVGSNFDTFLAIYQQVDGELVELGCNDDFSSAVTSELSSVILYPDTEYFIMVGATWSLGGNLDLHINLTPSQPTIFNVDPANITEIDDGICSLREAIIAANTDAPYKGCPAGSYDDIIELSAGTYILPDAPVPYDGTTVDEENNGLPIITSPITINGNGATIERDTLFGACTTPPPAAEDFRILFVDDSGSLILNDVTINNGCNNAILNQGALKIENGTTLSSNEGAVYNQGGMLSIDSSIFAANTIGIQNEQGTVNVYNSNFDSHTNIAIWNAQGNLSVYGGTFYNNFGSNDGSAIRNYGTVNILDGVLFSTNTSHNGGAIYNDVIGTISNITNSTFLTNTAIADGGAIYNNGIIITTVNNTFAINTAQNGGAIFNNQELSTFANNTIANNSADISGSGIYTNDTIRTFSNNIIAYGVNSTDCVNNGTLIANTNNLIQTGNCNPQYTADPLLGGLFDIGNGLFAYALQPNSPAIDAGNPITCAGSGISNLDQRGYARKLDGDSNGSALCDPGSLEYYPYYPIPDGVVAIDPNDGMCSLKEAIIAANSDTVYNECQPGTGNDTIQLAQGGTYILTGVDNISASDGSAAGLPLIADAATAGTLTIEGNDATIQRDGAATQFRIFHVATGGNLTLNKVTIENGYSTSTDADKGGGGIANEGTLTLNRSTIISNEAAGNGGGVVNWSGGTLNVFRSSINSNTAAGDGGGIYNVDGIVDVNRSTLAYNIAGNIGGGIFNGYVTGAQTTVTNSTISTNTNGGVVNGISGSTVYLNNSTIAYHLDGTYAYGLYSVPVEPASFETTNIIVAYSGVAGCNQQTYRYGVNMSDDWACSFPGWGGIDPLLGPLTDNGNGLLTHALQAGSQAIDGADPDYCSPAPVNGLDQRGYLRDTRCDIGAVEYLTYSTVNDGAIEIDPDDDACSLIEAIIAANTDTTVNECQPGNDADTIRLVNAGNYTLTNSYNETANGLPTITSNITIEGDGATIQRNPNALPFRLFFVESTGNLTLRRLTLSNGSFGGIYNNGTLTVAQSAVLDNSGVNGGGVMNDKGSLTVLNSTFSGNSAINDGGAIMSVRENGQGDLTVFNSTIAHNTVLNGTGGGIGLTHADAGFASIGNSIFMDNTGDNCVPGLTDNGYNISNDGTCGFADTNSLGLGDNVDPLLGNLSDNGSSTQTYVPLAGSSALNNADQTICITAGNVDQRGFPRIIADHGGNATICDIGAYEHTLNDYLIPDGAVADDAFDGVCSLPEAVIAANTDSPYHECHAGNGHDRIVLAQDGLYSFAMPGSYIHALEITSEITIEGNNAILERTFYGIIETSTSSDLTLNNITIRNASTFSAITSRANLTMVNSAVIDSVNAIGISHVGGNLTVINSVIDNNGYYGISFQGNDTTVAIIGSVISNNGRGIHAWVSPGQGRFLIEDSVIVGNTGAYGEGSGMYLSLWNDEPTIIRNSIITNNTATGNGAGIYVRDGYGDLILEGTSISENHSGGYGAGIFIDGDAYTQPQSVIIANSTLHNNTADVTNGGTIYMESDSGPESLIIENSTVANNNYGVVYEAGSPTIDVYNSIFYNNTNGNCLGTLNAESNNISNDATCGFTDTGGVGIGDSVNPILDAPLTDGEGGWYYRLLNGSPALDNGDSTVCANQYVNNLDQLGHTRPEGAGCDIGALELVPQYDIGNGALADDPNDGLCSLVEAIIAANTDAIYHECHAGSGADLIVLDNGGNYTLTSAYNGMEGLPAITSDITIESNGATIARDSAAPAFRLFTVQSTGTLTLNQITLAGGSGDNGGAIYNAGNITITNSLLMNNTANNGGGVYNEVGTIQMGNTTLSGNIATNGGGAIYNTIGGGTIDLTNVTIAENSATTGSGILTESGTTSMQNTLLANTPNGNCAGISVIDNGTNISSDTSCGFTDPSSLNNTDPLLDTLRDNDGPTWTHALLTNSPAIDTGNISVCKSGLINNVDARNSTRTVDGHNIEASLCDIGAFEHDLGYYPIPDGAVAENPSDSTCSLIEAIIAANTDTRYNECNPGNGVDTISLTENGTYPLTEAYLGSENGLPEITSNIIIEGNEATIQRDNSATGEFRILKVIGEPGGDPASIALTLNNITINGASLLVGGPITGSGGGIFVGESTLTLNHSIISNNSSVYYGGGVFNYYGTLNIYHSTITGNQTGNYGGGIASYGRNFTGNQSRLFLVNSTVADNSAYVGGGLLVGNPSTGTWDFARIVNSTIVNNTTITNAGNQIFWRSGGVVDEQYYDVDIANTIISSGAISGTNCEAAFVPAPNDLGGNISDDTSCQISGFGNGVDPLLVPFGDHLYVPGSGSPAIDNGDSSYCEGDLVNNIDQRDYPRNADGDEDGTAGCDVGAIEYWPYTPVPDGAVAEDPEDGVCSLTEAIIAANTGTQYNECQPSNGKYRIKLATNGQYRLDAAYNGYEGLPLITSNITIEGNGSTIYRNTAAPDFRLFTIASSGDLTLGNLTVSDGAADNGGAIHNEGTLTANDVVISDNSATNGGGLYITSTGSLNFINSTISGNSASSSGGGVFNSYGNVTLDISTVSDNNAQHGSGTYNDGGTLSVLGTTVSTNNASGNGGAVYNASGTLDLNGSTLVGNTGSDGAGLFNEGTATIVNTTFSANSATNAGGAIYNFSTGHTVTLLNSTLANDSATSGGAINNNGAGIVTLANSILASALGGDCGGTITDNGHNIVSDSTCNLTNTGSMNNMDPLLDTLADNGGPTWTHALQTGSLALDAGDTTICNGSDINNLDQRNTLRTVAGISAETSTCDIGAYEHELGYYAIPDGVIDDDTDDSICSLSEAIIAANTDTAYNGCAPGSGHDVIVLVTDGTYTLTDPFSGSGENGLPIITSAITINGNAATINRASATGFRIFTIDANGDLTLNHTTISGGDLRSVGSGEGGGIHVTLGALTLDNNSVVSGNYADNGGGIYNSTGTVSIFNSQISLNEAVVHGGGIYVENGPVTIETSTVTNNTALNDSGGGIFVELENPTIIINSFIQDNIGGGIYYQAGIIPSGVPVYPKLGLTITGSQISGNNGTWQQGGGLYVGAGTLAVFDSTITNNQTQLSEGGGVYINSKVLNATITNSMIANNQTITGTRYGGGIANYGPLTISGSVISENWDADYGGGIANWGELTLMQSTIVGNNAINGGAVFNNGNSGVAVIGNSTFSGNVATNNGGAVYNTSNGSVMTIINSTLATNTATIGSTVYNDNTTAGIVNVGNSILDSSSGNNCNGAIYDNGNNISSDGSCGFANTNNLGIGDNINALLAIFGDYGGLTHTYALESDSPAIDTGDSTVCNGMYVNGIDQRGEQRIFDGNLDGVVGCDIGAYEYPVQTEFSITEQEYFLHLDAAIKAKPDGQIDFALPDFHTDSMTVTTSVGDGILIDVQVLFFYDNDMLKIQFGDMTISDIVTPSDENRAVINTELMPLLIEALNNAALAEVGGSYYLYSLIVTDNDIQGTL